MECLDILDCRGRKTGDVVRRDEAHRSGIWHGAFHCLIIYKKGGRGQALFQKRSGLKKIAPGRFDVSVGGHYAAGEDAHVSGPREISEEIGLDVKFEELTALGRRVFVYCFEPGIAEYEFQDIFLLPRTIPPVEVRLQAEEVDGLLEMEVEQGIRLLSGEIPSMICGFRTISGESSRVATAEEFVPCLDNYYLKLLILAKKYFKGDRKLLLI